MPEERIDLGALRAPEGYFLLRDNPVVPFVGAAANGDYRHRFSYRDSAPTIRESVVDMVRRARHKVFIASFRIGDKELLDALFAAVDRLRGGVYVITSWTEDRLRSGLAALEDDAEADLAAQRHRFDDMTRRGIALRGHEQCHAKFVVVDDEVALVSSANLETSALADRKERKVTGESGAVVTDRVEVWPGSSPGSGTPAVRGRPCPAPSTP